jgi:hypothetical protein
MTEEEWLACEDGDALLKYLRDKATDRKLRLLGVDSCRRIWHLLQDERSRKAVEAVEQFADGVVSESALEDAQRAAYAAYYARCNGPHDDAAFAASNVCIKGSWHASTLATGYAAYAIKNRQMAIESESPAHHVQERVLREQKTVSARVIREVFGNPFRPVAFDPVWRTSDVMLLAEGIYAERAFERMPILADAIQDAGGDSADILAHLRDATATHVRGCWALDLVLGKE